jgi:hypothetical protein
VKEQGFKPLTKSSVRGLCSGIGIIYIPRD